MNNEKGRNRNVDLKNILIFSFSFQGAIVSLVFCIFNGEVRMTGKIDLHKVCMKVDRFYL